MLSGAQVVVVGFRAAGGESDSSVGGDDDGFD